jgi:tRNA(Ile)-lysidine synthase
VLEQFLIHIRRKNLFLPSDRVLLAVSGGVDSMVMLHLFRRTGFSIGVAHCNFQLRSGEAEKEQSLVEKVCGEHKISLHVRAFDTAKYAGEHSLSIQVAARELRYSFFEELCTLEGYNYVATAHHHNDNLETVLLNLVRGTGIDGLTGIPPKNRRVIRPMLFATRQAIADYAKEYDLEWREDSSNSEDHYSRNLLRNKVIPLLKQINPGLEDSFAATLLRLNGGKYFAERYINDFRRDALTESAHECRISINHISSNPFPSVLLWELVKEKGFNLHQCEQAVTATQVGKQFHTDAWVLTVDRDHYILSPTTDRMFSEVSISADEQVVVSGTDLLSIEKTVKQQFVLSADSHIAQMDLGKVNFPLQWRRWRPGDSFSPLGMNTRKKLSDFLIDIKVPLSEKQDITVLESHGEIVWVVGYRISNRVKITGETKEIIVIEHRDTRARKVDKTHQ